METMIRCALLEGNSYSSLFHDGLNPNSPLSSSTVTPPTFRTPPIGFPFTDTFEEAYSALWNFKVLRFWHFKLPGWPTERHAMAQLRCCSAKPWSSHNICNVFDATPRLWLWAATEWKSLVSVFNSGCARQILKLRLTTKRRSKSNRQCCSYFSSFFSSQNQSSARFIHSLIYKSYLLLLLSWKLLHGCEQEVCQNRWNAHGAKWKMLSFMVWRILWGNSSTSGYLKSHSWELDLGINYI